MLDLATLADYAAEDASLFERHDTAKFVVTVFVTVAVVMAVGTPWSDHNSPQFWSGFWALLGVGFVLGIAVAYARFNAARRGWLWRVQRRIEGIFAEDPGIVPPAPPGSTHRLVCAVMVSQRQAVGGILYVREHGFTFQTNYRRVGFVASLSGRQVRSGTETIEIGPPGSITLHQSELKRSSLWFRMIGVPPAHVLICRWENGAVALSVPLIDTVEERLQRCIDSLRAAV